METWNLKKKENLIKIIRKNDSSMMSKWNYLDILRKIRTNKNKKNTKALTKIKIKHNLKIKSHSKILIKTNNVSMMLK